MLCIVLWSQKTLLGSGTFGEKKEYAYDFYDLIIELSYRAINRDVSVYHDPDSFIPERFMDPKSPEPVNFGFGRR
jgi:hypothetical protein